MLCILSSYGLHVTLKISHDMMKSNMSQYWIGVFFLQEKDVTSQTSDGERDSGRSGIIRVTAPISRKIVNISFTDESDVEDESYELMKYEFSTKLSQSQIDSIIASSCFAAIAAKDKILTPIEIHQKQIDKTAYFLCKSPLEMEVLRKTHGYDVFNGTKREAKNYPPERIILAYPSNTYDRYHGTHNVHWNEIRH